MSLTIQWLNKIDGLDLGDPQKNVNASDMNEIKTVTNTNAGTLDIVAGDLSTHTANTSNPHSVTKTQVGLSAADNTSDADKPVSTAQAAAIAARLPLTLTGNTNVTGAFDLSLGTSGSHLDSLSVYTETQLFLHAQSDLTVNVHAAVGTDVVGISVTPNQVAIAAGFANSTTLYIRDENSSTAFEINAVDGGITLDANANNVVITGANIALNGNITSLIDSETPSGTMNSSNPTFTLANTPVVGTVKVYWNGQRLKAGVGYTISGATLTMTTPPDNGDTLECDYRK